MSPKFFCFISFPFSDQSRRNNIIPQRAPISYYSLCFHTVQSDKNLSKHFDTSKSTSPVCMMCFTFLRMNSMSLCFFVVPQSVKAKCPLFHKSTHYSMPITLCHHFLLGCQGEASQESHYSPFTAFLCVPSYLFDIFSASTRLQVMFW